MGDPEPPTVGRSGRRSPSRRPAAGAEPARWHDRTLERSLQRARARALARGDRFISAAAALLRDRKRPDFTVQEVVDRSGMSLRSFYHHFATKDDLLLALIEESVRAHNHMVAKAVASYDDPVDQLRAFLVTYYGEPARDDPAAKGMAIFHLQLAESRAAEYAATLSPQVALLMEILERGVASKQFRTDVSVDKMALFLVQTLVASLNMRVLEVHLLDGDLSSDDLLELCLSAVVATKAPAGRRTSRS
jgi:AcrR family transcriptional regulator